MKPPLKPPVDWFSDPRLDALTPLTADESGRVFGHIASWSSCHTGFAGVCVRPPRSPSGYAYFHTGQVQTAEGDTVYVGRVTMRTTHPSLELSAAGASDHYAHTGMCAAVVRAGEDNFGIWHAGALLPHLSDLEIAEFRRHPPSGDWRTIRGHYELIGTLCVNLPGYPIQARVAAGVPVALVAAGMLRKRINSGVELQRLRAQVDPTGALAALVAQV